MAIVEPLSSSGASEALLQQLESELGTQLPGDYRCFLAETNGGRPAPSRFAMQTSTGSNESVVDWFLTLDPKEDLYTVLEYRNMYSDRIPEGLLPIACDPFGNLLLLDLGGKVRGSVYFWDHEQESMDKPTWDNISVVAQSFTDFLNTLE